MKIFMLCSQNLGVFPHIRENFVMRVEVLPCIRCMTCELHIGERPRAAEIFVFGEISIGFVDHIWMWQTFVLWPKIKLFEHLSLSQSRKLHAQPIYYSQGCCIKYGFIPRVWHLVAGNLWIILLFVMQRTWKIPWDCRWTIFELPFDLKSLSIEIYKLLNYWHDI